MDVSSGAERATLLGLNVGFCHGQREEEEHEASACWPSGRGDVRDAQQLGPVHMDTKGRDSPWVSWVWGLPQGQHPKSLLPKDAGWGGSGWGPSSLCHSATARQRRGHNDPGQDKREQPPHPAARVGLGVA